MYCTPRLRGFARPSNSWINEFFPSMNACGPSCDTSAEAATYRLPIDVSEKNGNYVVIASVPGFTKEEITIEFHDGIVTIEAKHAESKDTNVDESGTTWHRRERRQVNVSRSVRLPDGITGENIGATVENGILTVTIPQPPSKQPQKIKVN